MTARTFRFELRVTDDNGVVTTEEFCSFRPDNVDEFGSEETVNMLVERVLRAAKYDAQQLDLEAEQDSAENRADHEYKIRRDWPAELDAAYGV